MGSEKACEEYEYSRQYGDKCGRCKTAPRPYARWACLECEKAAWRERQAQRTEATNA